MNSPIAGSKHYGCLCKAPEMGVWTETEDTERSKKGPDAASNLHKKNNTCCIHINNMFPVTSLFGVVL